MDNSIDIVSNIAFNGDRNSVGSNNNLNSPRKNHIDISDTTIRSKYASIIEKSFKTAQFDLLAVDNARKIIENGQLQSQENIQSAAQNILKYGI